MKNLITLVSALFAITATAQDHTKPKDGTKHTDKSAVEMTAVKKDSNESTPKDRSAGAGGSLTVGDLEKPRKSDKKRQQIPDGSYKTIRSGQPYSPANPNYPYDQTGKLIQNDGVDIISGGSTNPARPKNTQTAPAKAK